MDAGSADVVFAEGATSAAGASTDLDFLVFFFLVCDLQLDFARIQMENQWNVPLASPTRA